MDNIKESKEYKLAKEWEMAVNSFSFNPKRFAAAIPDMHPTLQQSLYRLFKECIIVMAERHVAMMTAIMRHMKKQSVLWNTSRQMESISH